MLYSAEDRAFVRDAASNSTSRHVKALAEMVGRDLSYAELFYYGLRFLPQLRDPATNKINLERLHGYKPEIVEFFEVISEMPSMSSDLRDMATVLAIYANGESVQTDHYYYQLDPELALNLLFQACSKPK